MTTMTAPQSFALGFTLIVSVLACVVALVYFDAPVPSEPSFIAGLAVAAALVIALIVTITLKP